MTSLALVRRARHNPAVWVLAATLVAGLACTAMARVLYPEWWRLVGYFWYSIPGNSFVYLPHEPAVLAAARYYDPWMVAVVGGFSTLIAGIVDYYLVRRVFEFRRVSPVKQTRLYLAAIRYFYWQPWLTIVFFAFSPLPYYIMRVLAPSSNYPLWRYVSAYVTGRVPRYYLLALMGAWLPVATKYLILLLLFIMFLSLIFGVLGVRGTARERQEMGQKPD